MRYRWDEDVGSSGRARVTADDEEVASTDVDFWGSAPRLTVGDEEWAFRVEPDGLVGARDGVDRLGIERGRIWHSSWPMAGLEGPLRFSRTTSWLSGKLYFDLHRDGTRIAEVAPEGPWQYRPSIDVSGALAHAEAVFALWAAYRIDARRPQRQIRPGGIGGGGLGA